MATQPPGVKDFSDPAPSARLSRKNILALALTAAGVMLALFFSSRRASAPPVPRTDPPALSYDGLTPITVDDPAPVPSPSWRQAPSPRPRQEGYDRVQFDQARRARPLVHSAPVAHQPGSERDAGNAPVLRESTVIEAALETAIHSDRPGPVLARVVQPVMNQEGDVLIAAGSRLVGAFTPSGQRHVLVFWESLELADGPSIPLPRLAATETTGESGLSDQVDRHRTVRMGSRVLTAVLRGATTALLAPSGLAGAALGMELSRSGNATLQPARARAPTVRIRAGYRFQVRITENVALRHRAQ